MAEFTDNAGRKWVLTLDVVEIRRVSARTGFRLDKLFGDNAAGLEKLFGDPLAFVDVLFVLVEPRAKEIGVSDEQFGRSLAGDAIDDAAKAFMEALADFSPSRQRKVLRALAAKTDEVMTRETELMLAEIAKLGSSKSAANSPGSSELIPAP